MFRTWGYVCGIASGVTIELMQGTLLQLNAFNWDF